MLRKVLTLCLFLSIFGCVNTSMPTDTNGVSPKVLIEACLNEDVKKYHNQSLNCLGAGLWKGQMKMLKPQEITFGNEENGMMNFLLVICESKPEIWLTENEEDFNQMYSNYDISFEKGNLIMKIIESKSGWVESQLWSFVFVNKESAIVQWNRLVSNIELDETEELRTFGLFAHGELEKMTNGCDSFK